MREWTWGVDVNNRPIVARAWAALSAALLSASSGAASVDAARIVNADREPAQWLSVGRTWDEQRHSPLRKITTENVSRLGLAWYADLDVNRGQEATPLFIDGRLYVTTSWSKVHAFDARTGARLWSYDPEVPPEWGIKGCCDVVNRGLAAWGNNLYLGSYDGRLIALDARTGKPRWEVDTIDRSQSYSITGAPRVVRGKVIIGNAGSEFGVRGYVSAYDADDGRLLWRFHTVPGDPSRPQATPELEKAVATWKGDTWWKTGGGGTVWDGLAYDAKLNLVYFGTGNGTPWVAATRSPGGGDNLFLNSIVAVDADTGRYAWHYQVVPEETWDYDTTSPLVVAHLTIEGRKRRVVMQASKNGFFYVLDAKTGKLISAKNYVPATWATHVDLGTGRPAVVPDARYDLTGKPAIVQPGAQGAHSWHPMSFSPRTGLVYSPAIDTSMAFALDPAYEVRPGAPNAGTGRAPPTIYEDLHSTAPRRAEAQLVAWDPVKQQEAWRVRDLGTIGAGVLTTAGGLVFQGTNTGEVRAYRDTDGELLWKTSANTGVVAAPMTYEIGGEQYVAQLAGYGGRDYYAGNESRLLVFKLGGTATLPPPKPVPPPRELAPPAPFGAPEEIERGRVSFERNCAMCHETPGGNRGLFPDLRYSPMLGSADAFRAVVIDGVLTPRGMVSFRDRFDAAEAEAIRAYLTRRSHEALAIQRTGGVVR